MDKKMKLESKLGNLKLTIVIVILILLSGFLIFNKLNEYNMKLRGIVSEQMVSSKDGVNKHFNLERNHQFRHLHFRIKSEMLMYKYYSLDNTNIFISFNVSS